MLIRVKTDDVNLVIPIPNFLIDNRLAANIIMRICEDTSLPATIQPEQLLILLHEISHLKRNFGQFNLIEVDTAKGEHIRITI